MSPVADGLSIVLEGDLCHSSASAVEQRLRAVPHPSRVRRIDLRRVAFVDLRGIDVITGYVEELALHDARPKIELGAKIERLVGLLRRGEVRGGEGLT